MNKTSIGVIVAVIILGGFIWVARPDTQNTPPSTTNVDGSLIVEGDSNYNFGSISMGAGKVKNVFKIKNTSDEPVVINKIYTSCMCTVATLITGDNQFGPFGMPGHEAVPKISQTVNPDEEVSVEVVFDPAAHGPAGVGKIQRMVIIENSAGQPIELEFTAMVTP